MPQGTHFDSADLSMQRAVSNESALRTSWRVAPLDRDSHELMPMVGPRPWIDPLSLAPSGFREQLESLPALRALLARGWLPETTLLYVPRVREGYDLDVAIVGRIVEGDSRGPTFWAFSTVGLSNAEQAANSERPGFRRFELVLATNNDEKADPFPARLGVALRRGPEGLPAWDWSQVRNPPLLDWLVIAGEEVGAAIRSGARFALADTLTLGPGNSEWTKSQLDHSILLPACPPLLAAGFEPFGVTAPSGVVLPSEWHLNPSVDRFEDGFVWLLPVSKAEFEEASSKGSWNVFARLVELSVLAGRDECGVAFDLLRRG